MYIAAIGGIVYLLVELLVKPNALMLLFSKYVKCRRMFQSDARL